MVIYFRGRNDSEWRNGGETMTSINSTKWEVEADWRDWKKKNQELYRTLRSSCVSCGTLESLQIHHKDGDKRNNEISNLTCLCWDCHRTVHKAMSVRYKVII